jgi:hypothetical protein
VKTVLVLAIIGIAAWFAWKKYEEGGGPAVITDPVYAEIRASVTVQNREIEMALFVRSSSELDCRTRARVSWAGALRSCETCTLAEPKCQKELPPRYARLFDDVPIPSTYLSATGGVRGERDGRLVVYGLTDKEGEYLCEMIRSKILENYKGTAHCVPASGG